MNRLSHIATLTALALAVATSMQVSAMEKSDPGGCTGGVGSDLCSGSDGGGGPGDPILEPSKMPRGGDAAGEAAADRAEKAAERKRKEAERRNEEERKRREAEAAQSSCEKPGQGAFVVDHRARRAAVDLRSRTRCTSAKLAGGAEPRGAMPGQRGPLRNEEHDGAADGDADRNGGAVALATGVGG